MTSKWLKMLAAGIAIFMAITAAGCNKDGESSSSSDTTAEATTEEESVLKVGFIFHGSVDEGGLSGELNAQRLSAASHSSIESCYIDNVNISDFEGAVKALIEAGCSTIVSASPVYTNTLSTVAGKNMNVDFIGYGARMRSVNIYAYTDLPFQGAYVAGMAAAYNSENEKIGFVCDPDMLYATPVINAAALGMQLVYAEAELKVAVGTRDSEVRQSVDALKKSGCDVIICYTETDETARYCQESGIPFIDYRDHRSDYEEFSEMLMYFYGARDTFFLSQFKQLQLDTWEASSYVGTAGNGIINISGVLPAAKDGTQDIVSALIPKVANGQAYIFDGELRDTSGSIRYIRGDRMDMTEVYDMAWYVRGVDIVENFRQPTQELIPNEFVVKS